MACSSSSSSFSNSSSSSSDDEVLYDMDQEVTMFFHAGFITCTSRNLFKLGNRNGRGEQPFCGPNNY
jgi:hypothetical protein